MNLANGSKLKTDSSYKELILIISRLYQGLLELIFPSWPECPVCGREFSHGQINLCQKCIDKIEFIQEDYCLKCGKLVAGNTELCYDCRSYDRVFEECRAVGLYSGGLEEYIKLFKYSRYRTLADPLADLLSIYLKRFYAKEEFDYITYIPVHRQRLEERGFNQAALLAKRIGSKVGIPVSATLIRRENTIKQSRLSRQDRLTNVQNKFSFNSKQSISKQRILLIDDIYTTGATVNEASRILLENGARSVSVLTLAIGGDVEL